MRLDLFRALLALGLSWLVACPSAPAQSSSQGSTKSVEARMQVKPDPKRAKKLVEIGAKAEAAGDYKQALAAYEEAARFAPMDVTIISKGAALRSKLVRGYMDNAERLALEGNIRGATEQLAAALHADPTNATILERLQQMEAMRVEVKDAPIEEPPLGLPKVVPNKATKSFRIQTDLRSAFEQVAAAYGIKVSFDPELVARNVKLRVEDVDFETAVRVLTLETGTFWRPVNAKLMFVAADTAEKRRAYEPVIEQTFPLPTSVTATEMTEIVRAVRELTGVQRVQQSLSAHTLTVRDTVPRVRLAGEIIRNLENAPGELLLELDFLEVDRSNAEKLGITPPAKTSLYSITPSLIGQLRSAPSLTALLTILASIFGTGASGGLTSLSSAIPPIIAIGGGKSTFLLTLPSASADFSQSLSLVQSGRQVLMRAQNGKPATFFVGERYPITLSLLSGSLGSAGFTPSVGGTGFTIQSEQFTVGQGPVSMVAADFRLSSQQDLAVLNQIDNTITILLNQGTGAASQFAQAAGSPVSLGTARTSAPPVPAAMATGSLNSATDSLPDLLVTDPVANTVTVLLENSAADGTFTIQPNPIAVGNEPSAIVVGNFNSTTSSAPGFVVTNFLDNTYSVFTGNGDGTFTQVTGSPFALPAGAEGPIAIAAADFNADGLLDLAIVNETTNNVTLLQGKGDGTLAEFPKSPLAAGNIPVAIASGDLAGSTGPALAIANQKDNTVSVYLGNGDGTFVAATQSPLATSSAPSGVVISDLVQQSTGGIAVTNRDSGTVTVFLDLGSGLFTNALEPAAGTNPGAIMAGDFATSTFPDIVVANNLSGSTGQVTLLVSPASVVSNPAIAQQPYPGSEYVDVGLKVKATPSFHANREVTLQMDYEIKSLSGSNLNGIPVISNRSLTQTIRLKEDETSILTGLLDREETKTLTGLPGLAGIPGAGNLFGARNNSLTDNELLILITPRRVRAPIRESRSIYAGRGDIGGRASVGAGPPAVPGTPEPRPPVGAPETPVAPTQPPPEQPSQEEPQQPPPPQPTQPE
jgi:type II secretory pathway component GspD/PulD (secretin)